MPDLRILAPHPIQYQIPVFRKLIRAGVDIEVGFYHQASAGQKGFDPQIGMEIEWDIDLLSGYKHQFFLTKTANYSLREQMAVLPAMLRWILNDSKTPLLMMGWFTHTTFLFWLARILLGRPIFLLAETNQRSFWASPKSIWRLGLQKWLIKNSTALFYIGTDSREFWLEMGAKPEKLFHTPYSVDNDYWHQTWLAQLPNRSSLCDSFGLDKNLPSFLFVGKLISKKRPVELLQSYIAAGLGEKAQLIYVGSGELKPKLEELIKANNLQHVHLLGFFNQSQMPLAYVLGEILCLPSDETETWGLVVNEALACQRPVILSDRVGSAADLLQSDNGWQFPFDNYDTLSNLLLHAYHSYNQWTTMGANGFRLVQNHTFDAMVIGIQQALESSAI
jgi:glycosyltransferase involved in cell wall biosynthesis